MSNYQKENERLAAMFKALGNPHRLALFQRLTSCCTPGTACTAEQAIHQSVGELGDGMGIAPSTLSHHLKELHRAGLIAMQRQGKQVVCRVEQATLDEIAGFFTVQTENTR